MNYNPVNPLIVVADRTVLVEVDNPLYAEARDALAPFAELEKSPEHIHTYRLTPLSLWNAAAAGMSAETMVGVLQRYTKYPLPTNIGTDIADLVSRYGRVKLLRHTTGVREDAESPGADVGVPPLGGSSAEEPPKGGTPAPGSPSPAHLLLVCSDVPLLEELARQPKVREYLGVRLDATSFLIDPGHRGVLKQALITVGYPAEDLAGYTEGASLALQLRSLCRSGLPFTVRDYQREASEIFYAGGDARGGSGVIVLPCGAGKTIVGIAAMALMQRSTLVLTTGITAVKQWHREILDKTNLTEEQICEYTGETKDIGPVTLATYQILTYRSDRNEEFPHFHLFDQRDWGLIIYDEVHLLPAPVFRVTAQIQARRRMGLTATLVREDGRESDVFSLIGPKKYDVPWRELESRGWIAEAACTEVRIGLPEAIRMEYATAEQRNKYRIASENPAKEDVTAALLDRHADSRVLIIGQYLKQLRDLRERFRIPLITGQTCSSEREDLYGKFRRGEIRRLILSKVGNFAIDLPDANVLIQVSGTFGSRQEEAQRLGRILRPKASGELAHFYTLVTRNTREQEFAHHRQLFLTEQGYSYQIADGADLLATALTK